MEVKKVEKISNNQLEGMRAVGKLSLVLLGATTAWSVCAGSTILISSLVPPSAESNQSMEFMYTVACILPVALFGIGVMGGIAELELKRRGKL
jgi:hypothetical protein